MDNKTHKPRKSFRFAGFVCFIFAHKHKTVPKTSTPLGNTHFCKILFSVWILTGSQAPQWQLFCSPLSFLHATFRTPVLEGYSFRRTFFGQTHIPPKMLFIIFISGYTRFFIIPQFLRKIKIHVADDVFYFDTSRNPLFLLVFQPLFAKTARASYQLVSGRFSLESSVRLYQAG